MIAATTAPLAAPSAGIRPAARAGGGFGEAWDAAAGTPPAASAPRPTAAPPGAPANPSAIQGEDRSTEQGPPGKSTLKRNRAAPADDGGGDARPAPSGPTAPDLVALQATIAAMTGGVPPSPRAGSAAASSPAPTVSEPGEGRLAASDVTDGSLVTAFDPGVAVFALDAGSNTSPAAIADPAPVVGDGAPLAADPLVAHHLDLAGDSAWLDQLTRDIAQSADANGQLRFSLQPEHLGRLEVQLSAGAEGTAIRLTTETRDAHRIVADAQPQLVAEARAQGLRITETHVDLNGGGGSGAGHQSFGNQNSGGRPQPQPFQVAAGREAMASAPSPDPAPADALYA